MPGRYLEHFQPGVVLRHSQGHTITQAENEQFTRMTLNTSPLHLDPEYMKTTEFGRPLVNSCLTVRRMVGVSVADTTEGTAIANLGYDELRFPQPVFPGDTLRFETEVLAARASRSRTDAGIVKLAHRCYNQRNELVAACQRDVLVQRQPTGA